MRYRNPAAPSMSPEYHAWNAARQRCHNPNDPSFRNYGQRGIRMCDRWRESFDAFLADMGHRPSAAHTLDRRDNDGHYSPENCRWALRKVQNNNLRRNRLITLDGVTKTLTEWADTYRVPPVAVESRLARGWDEKQAVTTPVKNRTVVVGGSSRQAITIDGATRTVSQWIKLLGLSETMVRNRLHNGWDAHAAVTTPQDAHLHMLTFRGETKTANEWARTLGISEKLLHQRLQRGWSTDRALTKGKQARTDGLLTAHGETKSIREWAEQTGLPLMTIRSRLSRGCSPEEAISPKKRRRH